MSLTLDLSGKTAVVTGGVRGVGLGVSRALLEAGAEVIAVARREPGKPPEAAGQRLHPPAAWRRRTPRLPGRRHRQ